LIASWRRKQQLIGNCRTPHKGNEMYKTLGYSITFHTGAFEIFSPEGHRISVVRTASELFDEVGRLGLVHPDYSLTARLAIKSELGASHV
jgi:hypothetical protein